MYMKKIITGAFWVCFLLPACKETTTKGKEKRADDYRKKGSGNEAELKKGNGEFDISAPAGWTKTDTIMMGQRIVFVKSPREDVNDDFIENVNVLTEKIGSMQADEYVNASIINIKNGLTGFEQGKISDRSINGYEFTCMRYSHVYSGIPIDVDVYFILRSGTAYIITCSAKGGTISQWGPDFDKVIRSFKLN
jgi:hypothetical protein